MLERFFDVLVIALTGLAASACSSSAALPGPAPDCNDAPHDGGALADGASLEAGPPNCVVVVGAGGEPSGASSGTGASASGGAGSSGASGSSGIASSGGTASSGVGSSGAGSGGGSGAGVGMIGSSTGAGTGTSPVGASSGSI
jgi:hypothetical protein